MDGQGRGRLQAGFRSTSKAEEVRDSGDMFGIVRGLFNFSSGVLKHIV